MRKLQLFLIILCLVYFDVQALKCHICSTTENNLDQRCITNPEAVEGGITNCNKNYCTSVRIEYLDPKDKVQSMSRGCEDNPLFINQVIEDSTFRSYFKACQTELCNSGSGKDFSESIVLDADIEDNLVPLVPAI